MWRCKSPDITQFKIYTYMTYFQVKQKQWPINIGKSSKQKSMFGTINFKVISLK